MTHYLKAINHNLSLMMDLKLLVALLALSMSSNTFASGRHSETVSASNIKTFHSIKLSTISTPLHLNYIGSTKTGLHLFLENKVAVSKRIDKNGNERIGMPWNHILKYQISNKTITIKNGWNLDLDNDSYNFKPRYCPVIKLINNKTTYNLPRNKTIKKSCLSARHIRKRKN